MQLTIAVRVYATGSVLQVIGDTFGYNKSTVLRVVHAVTNAICCHGADFFRWPTGNERVMIMNGFDQIAQFPCVIGAVDGTHIRTDRR
jgi:hypothetical protein